MKGDALTEVTFYILLSLYTSRHGYAIMQFIEKITHERLMLGAGTLHEALTTLQKGWITPCEKTEDRKQESIHGINYLILCPAFLYTSFDLLFRKLLCYSFYLIV